MLKLVLFSVLIIAICIALLSVRVLLKKDGEFQSMHIHDSQAMKDRGIDCVLEQDRKARQGAIDN